VPEGAGMFNLPKATFSKQTQDLLKGTMPCYLFDVNMLHAVMMEESKLTNFQQRQLKSTLKSENFLTEVKALMVCI
jgi:hypothetical protein